jgi:hypothetical protein
MTRLLRMIRWREQERWLEKGGLRKLSKRGGVDMLDKCFVSRWLR